MSRANAYGAGLSPYGSSPQAVSPALPLPSLSQGENEMNAHTTVAPMVDVTSAMIALNIARIERYPGGFFTVALMDGSYSPPCKSVGEAFEKIQRRTAA